MNASSITMYSGLSLWRAICTTKERSLWVIETRRRRWLKVNTMRATTFYEEDDNRGSRCTVNLTTGLSANAF